jgi:hypothetical protein
MEEKCPFDFNFDPATFKAGDTVSYRVTEEFGDFPFVGTIIAVHPDYIEITANDPSDPHRVMRATRASRPEVTRAAALG